MSHLSIMMEGVKPVAGQSVRCVGGPYDGRRVQWLGGSSMLVRPKMHIDDGPLAGPCTDPEPIPMPHPTEYVLRMLAGPRRRYYYAAPREWSDDRCIARLLGESEDGL